MDRELIELLNELRVVLTGVQVLFAFLLILPFTDRFDELVPTQQLMFAVAFTVTATASTAGVTTRGTAITSGYLRARTCGPSNSPRSYEAASTLANPIGAVGT